MAEIKIEIDDSALQRVIANGRKLGLLAVGRIENTLAGVADKILARAIEKTPVQSGTLKRSGTSEVRKSGDTLTAHISFGGMSSKYAEVQHENEDFTHTREAWVAKYGTFLKSRSSLKTQKVTYFNKRGKRLKLKGHKGGQAHFLYGAENSAWDSWMASWTSAVITRRLEKEADRLL